MSNKKIPLSKLTTFLKKQCDQLRQSMDASEYKDYIIALLFLKRVNDQFKVAREERKSNLLKKYPNLSSDILAEELEVSNAREYDFFVPVEARWEKLHTLHENIGDALTIALNALEKSNIETLSGVLSTTKFNATNSKGEKMLPDETLREMLRDFNKFPPLKDENFEFPDLLGAAYEYLIKYFAESAGKKGGEFYTPNEVVQLMGNLLRPGPKAEICDPTVGSGGLLINLRNYVEARYGSARNLTIHGQEVKESTYRMCKMNMIFHGIKNARIEQGDTLADPKLQESGQLIQYDIVIANPPFSQNYTKANMQHKERFKNWMSTKKQADFMFVQHMISVLKNNGRMAVVMPHGVLFRGGEEQKMRKKLISSGILEAVIGLPPGLFYGTGIPASILIINKAGAKERKGVFFINADKEYEEGKNQNKLRPEDIEKISNAYHNKQKIKKYSRLVLKSELEEEEFNCNIRRYVDNSPPAEPNDVRAHLSGGIPQNEIDALDKQFSCYSGLKENLFTPPIGGYASFQSVVTCKADIKQVVFESQGKEDAMNRYRSAVSTFWKQAVSKIEALPTNKKVYDFTADITTDFVSVMENVENPLLDEFQIRGSFAHYISNLQTDFKSVASSGWNAELIPDEEIIRNEFPEVLKELTDAQNRRDELEAQFAEVEALEEGEWSAELYEIIPKVQIKEIKDNIKKLNAEKKRIDNYIKALEKRIKVNLKCEDISEVAKLETEKAKLLENVISVEVERQAANEGIERHLELEEELRLCRAIVRDIENRKEELADKAREQISDEDAQQLIMARWLSVLLELLKGYLDAHTKKLQKAVERMYEKYTITLTDILNDREINTNILNNYLKELGYE